MNDRIDIVTVVTHPDPYPTYLALARDRPFSFDADVGAWIAAAPAIAESVLVHPSMRVRPSTAEVPRALVGRACGDLFARVARMTDGDPHTRLRADAVGVIESIDRATMHERIAQTIRQLIGELLMSGSSAVSAATAVVDRSPGRCIGGLLGLGDDEEIGEWIAHLAAAWAPIGADVIAVGLGDAALTSLVGRLRAGADHRNRSVDDPLDDREAAILGLTVQTQDATSGLIGNALVALGRTNTGQVVRGDAERVVDDTLGDDPPIHSTRRHVAQRCTIDGQQLDVGDQVIVLLGHRTGSGATLQFGRGAHACPGEHVARVIATAAVRGYLDAGFDPKGLEEGLGYRASVNLRVPRFREPSNAAGG